MAKKKSHRDLGARERQIMDAVFELGEASVGDVLEHLPDPPSYSSVRTMIRLLESKGFLRHRREGTKYVYRPTQSRDCGAATGSAACVADVLWRFGTRCSRGAAGLGKAYAGRPF